jgi:Cu(I)/Ag(I) efflux system membrane fusion protein
MLATQHELLLAARGEDKMRHSPISEAHEHARSLVAAARRRLELWDFSPEQMDAVLRTRQPVKTYTVFAPESGVVTSRNAYANQRITPDTNLYALADMSRVWILADLYEHDAPRIQPGQHGRVKAAYGAGRAINARVDYVMPTYNGETRTLQVRLDAPNPGQWMKPGMFVEVEFPIALPPRLTVPTEAVLDTGRKQTVFVDLGEGRLKAQEVRTGDEFDGRTEILEGLKAGDRIVISGNFLLDSETQLKPAAPPPAEHKHHD